MITVRFASGFSVTYNSASWVDWTDDQTIRLKDREDGKTIALVPKVALVEFSSPCAMSNPWLDLKSAVEVVLAEARGKGGWDICEKLAELKALLADFNRQTRRWK